MLCVKQIMMADQERGRKNSSCHDSRQDRDVKPWNKTSPLWFRSHSDPAGQEHSCNSYSEAAGSPLLPGSTLHRWHKVTGFFQQVQHVLFCVHITLLKVCIHLSTARILEINQAQCQCPANILTVGSFYHKYVGTLWLKQYVHLASFFFFFFFKIFLAVLVGNRNIC